MNQTFNFNRWWLLVARHWIENRKRYLLSLIVIPGLMLGWFGFILLNKNYNPLPTNIQFISYEGGLFIVGCFYASMIFSDLGSTPRGVNFLTVPASHLEKLVCAIFYAVLLFFVIYTISFYIIDIPCVKIGNILGYERFKRDFPDEVYIRDEVFNIFNFRFTGNDESNFYVFVAYYPIQSAFLLGSVYFARYSFIKTAIAVLALWLIVFIFFSRILLPITPQGWRWDNLAEWARFNNVGEINLISLPRWIDGTLDYLLKYSIPVILWVVTYFRLKEKEI
jgi:hypothetical protein